nr:AAA family ATPase [Aquabacterium sp.]
MSSGCELVLVQPDDMRGRIPIAHMRHLYRVDEVEKRLGKLPPREHESLRATYERMIDKGPDRFQVKPSGLPAMTHLYDELPNFHDVLDDLRRQLALCSDSRDALEITPMLLLGPPGVGKTHFAREVAQLLGTGMGFMSMSSLTAGWVLSGASSQWKGAKPGKVFETLVDGQYANPVMVVDEIDKTGGDHAYDPLGALY